MAEINWYARAFFKENQGSGTKEDVWKDIVKRTQTLLRTHNTRHTPHRHSAAGEAAAI